MSVFASSMEYEITSESEVTAILSHFEPELVLGIIDDALERKYMFFPNNPINLVSSLETNFSLAYAKLPYEKERIDKLREDIYVTIIDKICSHYNLELNITNQDIYTLTYYLYDFLISGFSNNIVSFFTNYIIKEKDYLYNHIGLVEMKKNKDMTTIYTKKLHSDPKLAVINANLEYVIDSISLFDISILDILNLVYTDKNIIELISTSVLDRGNIYKDHFVSTLNNAYKPVFITNMKFALLSIDNSGLTLNDEKMTENI